MKLKNSMMVICVICLSFFTMSCQQKTSDTGNSNIAVETIEYPIISEFEEDGLTYREEDWCNVVVTYPVLDKSFSGEEEIGLFSMRVETSNGKTQGTYHVSDNYYALFHFLEWNSLYSQDNVTEITATVYNEPVTFTDKNKIDNHSFKSQPLIINGNDNNIMLYAAVGLYSEEQNLSYEKILGEAFCNAIYEMKVKYSDGTESTDYYCLKSYYEHNINNFYVYKLIE